MNRIAIFAAACAAFGLAEIAPANAAATIAAGFYQEMALKSCTNTSTCVVKFSAIPAGKTLILRQVSCVVTSDAPVGASSVTSRNNGVLTQRVNYPPATYTGLFSGTRRYQINGETLDIMAASDVPEITVSTTSSATSLIQNCSISGELK